MVDKAITDPIDSTGGDWRPDAAIQLFILACQDAVFWLQQAEDNKRNTSGGGSKEYHSGCGGRCYGRIDTHLQHQRSLDDATTYAKKPSEDARQSANKRIQYSSSVIPLNLIRLK